MNKKLLIGMTVFFIIGLGLYWYYKKKEDDGKGDYTGAELRKDMRELKVENRVQTIAVILFFFFGISTIHDIVKKQGA